MIRGVPAHMEAHPGCSWRHPQCRQAGAQHVVWRARCPRDHRPSRCTPHGRDPRHRHLLHVTAQRRRWCVAATRRHGPTRGVWLWSSFHTDRSRRLHRSHRCPCQLVRVGSFADRLPGERDGNGNAPLRTHLGGFHTNASISHCGADKDAYIATRKPDAAHDGSNVHYVGDITGSARLIRDRRCSLRPRHLLHDHGDLQQRSVPGSGSWSGYNRRRRERELDLEDWTPHCAWFIPSRRELPTGWLRLSVFHRRVRPGVCGPH